jgi:hypothetical protein
VASNKDTFLPVNKKINFMGQPRSYIFTFQAEHLSSQEGLLAPALKIGWETPVF